MLFDKKIECSNCGKTISSKDTFCPNCGKINLDLDGHDFSIISKNKLSGVFTKKCPNCNSAIDRDTLYCPSCGKLVMNLDGYDFSLPIKKIRFSTPTKRCEYCGSTINRNALFCDGCGGVNVNLDGHDFSFINNEETKNENKKLKKKLSFGKIIGIIAAVAAVVGIIVLLVSSGIFNFDIKVPDVIGLSYDEACERVSGYGLNVMPSYDYSDDIARDHIISVAPDVGTVVEKNSTINLVVSQGTLKENGLIKGELNIYQQGDDIIIESIDSDFLDKLADSNGDASVIFNGNNGGYAEYINYYEHRDVIRRYGDSVHINSKLAFTSYDFAATSYDVNIHCPNYNDIQINNVHLSIGEKVTIKITGSTYGYVSGDGNYMSGEQVTIDAYTYNDGIFEGWYSEYGGLVSTDSSYTFTVTDDVTYNAKFRRRSQYTVNAYSNNSSYGYVTGGGTCMEGDSIYLNAYATNSQYVFDGWYQNSSLVSSDEYFVVTPKSSCTYTAKFVKVYDVSIYSDNTAMGKVESSAQYAKSGSTVTISAIPNSGYRFKKWSDNSTEQYRTITITSDKKLTAYFEEMPRVNVVINGTSVGRACDLQSDDLFNHGCSSSFSEKIKVGSIISFYVQPLSGYEFDYWEGIDCESSACTIEVTGSINATAHFKSVEQPISE